MKLLKDYAADLLAARSKVRNAEDDLRRAKEAYIEAECFYLNAMGDNCRSIVYQQTAINLSGSWPDSRKGEHLEFEAIEVLT